MSVVRRSNEELKTEKSKNLETKFTLKEQKHFKGGELLLKQMQYYERCYREGKPQITDEEWDQLVRETDYEESLDETVSPDGRIWKKMNAPLPSLKKILNFDDLDKYFHKFPSNTNFRVEPKLDGLTYSAFYKEWDNKEGHLEYIGTRGDGLNSLILKHDALSGVHIEGLPKIIDKDSWNYLKENDYVINGIFEIRGEAVIPKDKYASKDNWDTIVWRSIAAGYFNREVPSNPKFFVNKMKDKNYNKKFGFEYRDMNNISALCENYWKHLEKEDKKFAIKFGLIGKISPYSAFAIIYNNIYCKRKNDEKWILIYDGESDTFINDEYHGKLNMEYLTFISYSVASKDGNIDNPDIIRRINEKFIYVNDLDEFKDISCTTDDLNEIKKCIDNFYGTENGERDIHMKRLKNTLNYACDGIVIKPENSNNETQKMQPVFKNGKYVIPKEPNDQIAIKLPTEKVRSRILKINKTVTKLGNTTFSADIEPVVCEGGAVVKRVNLHGPSWLNLPENSWIKEGAECYVSLSMDIIPIIHKV